MKNNVRRYREDLTWTKAKLARESDVAQYTIAKMEKGEPTRRDSQLKVAKALGETHKDVFPDD